MENLEGVKEGGIALSAMPQNSCQSNGHGQILASDCNQINNDDAFDSVTELEDLLGNEEEFQSFLRAMESDEASNPSERIQTLDLNCNEVKKKKSEIQCIDLSSDDEWDMGKNSAKIQHQSELNSFCYDFMKNPSLDGKMISLPFKNVDPESFVPSPPPDTSFLHNIVPKYSALETPRNIIPPTPPSACSSHEKLSSGDFNSMKVNNHEESGNNLCMDYSSSKFISSQQNFNGSETFEDNTDSLLSNCSDANYVDINSPSPFTERLLLSEGDADSLLEPIHLVESKENNFSCALRTSEAFQFDKGVKSTSSGAFLDIECKRIERTASFGRYETVSVKPAATAIVLEAASEPEATSKPEALCNPAAMFTFTSVIPSLPSPPKISPSPPPNLPPLPSPPPPTTPPLNPLPAAPPLSAVPSPPAVPLFLDSNAPLPPTPSPPDLLHHPTSSLPFPSASPLILSAVPLKTDVDASAPDVPNCDLNSPIEPVEADSIALKSVESKIVAPAVLSSVKESDSSGHHEPNSAPNKPSWSEPWISNDDAENADNNDPQWELLRKLDTDEERYKSVREKWRQLTIPDPRRDLTRHNFRRSRSQITRGVDDANKKRKRTRSLEYPDFEGNPSKRRRMVSCTSVFDIKIDDLRKELDDDVAAIRDDQQRALYNLGIEQQKQQDNVMNLNVPHYIINQEINNLYYRQEQEVDELRILFDRKLERLYKGKMDSINLLRSASEEVLAFNKFYHDLDNADDDHLHITEEELQQFQETEHMYKMFERMYSG